MPHAIVRPWSAALVAVVLAACHRGQPPASLRSVDIDLVAARRAFHCDDSPADADVVRTESCRIVQDFANGRRVTALPPSQPETWFGAVFLSEQGSRSGPNHWTIVRLRPEPDTRAMARTAPLVPAERILSYAAAQIDLVRSTYTVHAIPGDEQDLSDVRGFRALTDALRGGLAPPDPAFAARIRALTRDTLHGDQAPADPLAVASTEGTSLRIGLSWARMSPDGHRLLLLTEGYSATELFLVPN